MIELKITKRDTQESTDYLRSQGLIPAVMYGAGYESIPVSVRDNEFRKVYRNAGTSNVITTTGDISGEMVLIQDMQVHVVSGKILNIDFKVVNKGETTEVTVPLRFVGESPAVKNNVGLLNTSREEVVLETIPSKIPDHIEIDISVLANLGDNIKVSDIKLSEGVKILDDINETIVSVIGTQEDAGIDNAESEPFVGPELVNQKEGEEK